MIIYLNPPGVSLKSMLSFFLCIMIILLEVPTFLISNENMENFKHISVKLLLHKITLYNYRYDIYMYKVMNLS